MSLAWLLYGSRCQDHYYILFAIWLIVITICHSHKGNWMRIGGCRLWIVGWGLYGHLCFHCHWLIGKAFCHKSLYWFCRLHDSLFLYLSWNLIRLFIWLLREYAHLLVNQLRWSWTNFYAMLLFLGLGNLMRYVIQTII